MTRRRSRVRSWQLAISMMLLPLVATAGPSRDTVAYPPMVVVGGTKAEAKQFDGLLAEVIRELGLKSAPADKMRGFLATQKLGRCVDNDCLDRLAHYSDAGRALLVSVAPFSRKVTLAGKAISVDGAPPKLFDTKEYAKKPNEPLRKSVKRALTQFLGTALGGSPPVGLPPSKSVAAAPAAPPVKPQSQVLPPAVVIESPSDSASRQVNQVPPVPYDDEELGEPLERSEPARKSDTGLTQTTSRSGQSWVGRTAPFVAGVGLAGLVLGTVLQLNANASWSNYNKIYTGQSLTPTQLEQVKSIHDRAGGQQTGAAISWAVGGAALAGGIAMFLIDPPWRSSRASQTGVSVSPSGVAISGVFP